MDLVVGAGKLDRTLQDVETLVDAYRTDDSLRYLDYQPLTPPGRMVPEDLAVTILINSRVAGTAFKAVQDHGDEVPLDTLPGRALEANRSNRRETRWTTACAARPCRSLARSVRATRLGSKPRGPQAPGLAILPTRRSIGAPGSLVGRRG